MSAMQRHGTDRLGFDWTERGHGRIRRRAAAILPCLRRGEEISTTETTHGNFAIPALASRIAALFAPASSADSDGGALLLKQVDEHI